MTTVAVLHPAQLHGGEGEQLRAVDGLRAVFPEVSFLVAPWPGPAGSLDVGSERDAVGAPATVTEIHRRALADAEVVVALDLPAEVIELAPRLRWVQAVGTGISHLGSSGLAEAGVRLTNAAGTASGEIAEFVFARVLQHAKRLREIDAHHAAGRWQPVYGRPVAGSTIGLVGLGAINARVGAIARAFGMTVVGCSRSGRDERGVVDRVHSVDRLTEMVAGCDVVVVALPETPETRGLLDASVFAAMDVGALFVNVGRGSAVVDDDLVDALASGHLGGAALDVFGEEPLPSSSRYWGSAAAYLSAHCSSVPTASVGRTLELFSDNLGRFLAGRPLRNEVDLERGYASPISKP